MPSLTLLIGPAGSGKTHRVLADVARQALAGALPSAEHPPLLVIVPEQQAVTTERALMGQLREISDGSMGASTRIHVMSLTRLANILADRGGRQLAPLGELGRRLLVWRLLDRVANPAERQARAAALADLVAELLLYGTQPQDLRQRAAELRDTEAESQAGTLAGKLDELADVLAGYIAQCQARELDHRPAAAHVPELLVSGNWPWLERTRVWVDGFAGFTPAEELALSALLSRSAGVTATLLLDKQRLTGPRNDDPADWYQPTRETYLHWRKLAKDCGVRAAEVWLEAEVSGLPRWPGDSPLAALARDGLRPQPETRGDRGCARAVACADDRAEVDQAARQIQQLLRDGYRCGEISVVCRSLEPYADLIAARFHEHGIPCFLDARQPLTSHALLEYSRASLRLILDQAGSEDVISLLKTTLLPQPDEAPDGLAWTERLDLLENYALAHNLRPDHWLRDEPWTWPSQPKSRSEDDGHPEPALALASRLDKWRRVLMQPLAELRHWFRSQPAPPPLRELLGRFWLQLLGGDPLARIEAWAVQAESGTAAGALAASRHRQVPQQLANLLDELVLLAGDIPVGTGGSSPDELCQWLEAGLAALSIGQPPARLDAVLITDIERGRHHPVRATLLLGLAEGRWPQASLESVLLSDRERQAINATTEVSQSALLGGGASQGAAREPYLALVAATRASDFLYISRPGADQNGTLRPPSSLYGELLRALNLTETAAGGVLPGSLDSAGSPGDLLACAALADEPDKVFELTADLESLPPAYAAALAWTRRRADQAQLHRPLADPELSTVLGPPDAAGRQRLKASPSRLEAFAACPFKHFARYWLALTPRVEAAFDARVLGNLYHELLARAVDQLNAAGYQWPGRVAEIQAALDAALDELLAATAAGEEAERLSYVSERARVLLRHLAVEIHARCLEYNRAPRLTELSIGAASGPLSPLRLAVGSLDLELVGYLDRLDLTADGLATVVDYKTGGSTFSWPRFLAGEQLQLFAYLLATEQLGPLAAEAACRPAAAEYQPIEPDWDNRTGSASFSAQRVPPELKRPADQAKLAGLLPHVLAETRRVIAELATRLASGEIAPWPLLAIQEQQWTACGYCDYRPVCRFDPLAGWQYRTTPEGGSAQLRDALAAGEVFPGSAGLAGEAKP
ncbi:PD-(D/E)XK nuclease family protein [bacterium]|nr:PD-(D/E)XK nuclease family protein [bacterium]